MTEQRVEDHEGRNEHTRTKRAIVPAGACCRCQEYDKQIRISVGNKRLRKSVGLGEELLPGILDDITLELITPKLSWRDLHVLRSVSPSWQQAIQSHLVYESKVRSQSTETLALVAHQKPSLYLSYDLSLYYSRHDTWTKLPRNPYRPNGILPKVQCVSLHGKLYILGGLRVYREEIQVGSREVYVLDLAGQWQWEKCSDMLEPRLEFGCGVIDGKIYVFGGTSHNKPVSGSEVYDPKVNAWSRIKPMRYLRVGHDVFKVGQELFVHGGDIYHGSRDGIRLERIADGIRFERIAALFGEVYNPVKDEWRLIEPFESNTARRIITTQGKVYLITRSGINHYDIGKLTHAHAQSFRCAGDFGWVHWPHGTILVDDELLALAVKRHGRISERGVIRSRGFGNEKEDIVWERCARPSTNLGVAVSMWAIQI